MRSYLELTAIEKDLVANKDSMLSILDVSTKEYLKEILDKSIADVNSARVVMENNIHKFTKDCVSKDFLEGLFKDNEVLKFLSSYTNIQLSSKDVLEVIDRLMASEKVDTTLQDRGNKDLHYSSSVAKGQVSSSKFSEMLGNPVFKRSGESTTTRERTKSEDFVIMYDKKTDSYKIAYQDFNKEVPNVYTLYDYFNNRKFVHYVDGEEILTSLGVNILSLKGFPSLSTRCGITNRALSDYVYQPSVNKSSMVRFNFAVNSVSSKFCWNNVLLRSFMSALAEMGYHDILFRYFSDAIQEIKSDGSEHFFKNFNFKTKVGMSDRIFIGSLRGGYLVFPSEFKIRKDQVFEVMRYALCCISEVINKPVDELMKLVRFYGGHDFANQGDDLNNFFNTDYEQTLCSPVTMFRDKNLDYFKKIGKGNKPYKVEFIFGNKKYSLSADVMQKKLLKPIDVVYFVVKSLLNSGVSIDEIVSVNRMLFNPDLLVDKEPVNINTGFTDYVKVDDKCFYFIDKYFGWGSLTPNLGKLFDKLNITGTSLIVYV